MESPHWKHYLLSQRIQWLRLHRLIRRLRLWFECFHRYPDLEISNPRFSDVFPSCRLWMRLCRLRGQQRLLPKRFNGEKIWQSPTGYWVWSSPAVADGNVYVGSEDYSIYCLNASTGAKEWSYETGNFVDSSPAIVNNTLYVGSDDNNIYAFALYNSTVETALCNLPTL